MKEYDANTERIRRLITKEKLGPTLLRHFVCMFQYQAELGASTGLYVYSPWHEAFPMAAEKGWLYLTGTKVRLTRSGIDIARVVEKYPELLERSAALAGGGCQEENVQVV